MNRRTIGPHGRRRTASGLPVEGVLPPRAARVIRRRHTGAWLALTTVLLLIVAATVGWSLEHSSYFQVRQVRVSGATALDQSTIADRSGVLGKQLYTVDASTVATKIEQMPLVRTASVHRLWPNRVAIDVQERQPWGTWQIGGVNYLIDNSGVVLDIVSAPSPPTVFELDAAPGLEPGDHVDADAVQMAQTLVQEVPEAILQQVTKLQYSTGNGLELLTDHGVVARIGDSQGLDYKLAVWRALNAKVGAKNVHFIDLRSTDRPYYR